MAYSKFSTEDADYYFAYGMHSCSQDDEIFQDGKINRLDAIVLEHSSLDPSEEWNSLRNHGQYESLLATVEKIYKEKTLPLYFIDAGTTPGGKMAEIGKLVLIGASLQITTGAGPLIMTLPGLLVAATGSALARGNKERGNLGKALSLINMFYNYLFPTPQAELRNAITAKKTAGFIAPKLKKELGKKPAIALVYGAGHTGIEIDLKYPFVRDSILAAYRGMQYLGIHTDKLETIVEAKYQNLQWNFKKYQTDLFSK